MEAFLTWPGWGGVSALAQLVALVTLFGAAWRYVLQRQQMPIFALDWTVLGTIDMNGGTMRYHVIEFRNIGRGPGEIRMLELIGAQARHDNDFLVPRVLSAGGTFRILITTPVISKVWFRITWRTQDSRRRTNVTWWPLVRSGELDAQRETDYQARRRFRRIRESLRQRPVEPGSVVKGVHRGRPWEDLHRMLGDIEKHEIYDLATQHNFAPQDLPYFPRPTPAGKGA